MSRLPDHLRAPEIKRRMKALVDGAKEAGIDVSKRTPEMAPDGTIRLVDTSARESNDGDLKEWV